MPFHQIVFAILVLFACGYAAARGGAPERVTAASFFAAFALTSAFRPSAAIAYRGVEWQVVAIDVVLTSSILFVAVASCRFWALLMAGMMLVSLLGHAARLLDAGIIAKAYYILVAIIGYPTELLLIVATWRHRVRLRRYGVDYSWVWQLPPAYRLGWLAVPGKDGDTL